MAAGGLQRETLEAEAMATLFPFGAAANVAQLAGLDAVRLITLIATAANNARMHKKNCRQFAKHLKLIGALLEQLALSDLRKRSETREPLEHLEDALRRAFVLVNSCQDKSYLYLLAMGWRVVNQFKEFQAEIDKYLKLIPLIALVENNRNRMLEVEKIENDKCEYTLDEQDKKVHDTILKPERTRSDTITLSRELSRRYPGMPLNQALRKENAKLRNELQQMQAMMEVDQVEVIEHLIGITETVDAKDVEEGLKQPDKVLSPDEPAAPEKKAKQKQARSPKAQHGGDEKESSRNKMERQRWEPPRHPDGWQNGLFDCWTAPCTCISTCLCPCSTFSRIANFVSEGDVSKDTACNRACCYTLCLGCCCYTSCFRQKVRKRYSISGNICDDWCAHTLCFCCALIQEWREIEFRELKGMKKRSQNALQAPGVEKMERQ